MLRAALEVISARGYADTRIADVAERAGVSPALVEGE
jgi:AcrR family transcriptional regulator